MRKKIITRTVWILSLVSMFADVASEMLYPVIPVYLRNIGFSVFLIGILEGIAEAAAGLSKGFFGKWSDHLGRRMPFVRLGYFLSALSKPMMVLLRFPLWIFFARTTDRLGKGLRTAPRDALLSAEATPETKAGVFSFHRGWDTLGAVIGPLIALAYLHLHPGKLTTLFYLAFIPGVIAVLFTFLVRERPVPLPVEKRSAGFLSYFKYWKKAPSGYRKLLIPLILFALFNSSDMLLVLKVRESAGSENNAIMAYIFFNLVYALAAYPLGRLADRFNMKKIFLGGLLLFSATYFGMAKAGSMPAFYAIFGIYGIYMAATEGISKAWITNLVKKEETGTAVGLFVSLQSISLMIASTLAGLIWSRFGAPPAFLLTAVISLVVFFYMLFFVKPPERPVEG
ncbi:MAG: MFS transporter [Prolixibacteraceae bacterium]|jgi:MFS family permease|nr:MFS transporter [Prolixibacteraceae bacterium]MDI9563592.1 MFS transporter [Bacteroidota bacterium]NLT00146.1 MFS transporter [Bacteroidales bacterium]OQB79481.1 MAG: drug efflux system protein MdtG [Bacteroidetes bacterium ADurb.Bin123]HNZ69773.1 MFS transporter [Prolixibacteraceae bacterium]